ncbi:Uncharacterised protein [Klebsiella oxytoca]|nr:Uncharacterised protein [Klebsiella oxytoca]
MLFLALLLLLFVHCRTGSLVIVAVTGAESGPSKPKREAA